MAFFRNNAVNLLNLHYGIHSIALGGGAAFFAVYLLKSGIPVPMVFVSLALILLVSVRRLLESFESLGFYGAHLDSRRGLQCGRTRTGRSTTAIT
jgi:hypothetical protein